MSTSLASSGTTPELTYNEASTWTEAPSIFDLASTLGGLTSPEFSKKIGFVSPGSSSAFSTVSINIQHKTMN